MSEDIDPILKEWDEDPDSGKIRKIVGSDGKEKIQIRVKFGMLQLEADGRPDAKRPYGKGSLLEHYLSLIEAYKEELGTDEGFRLDYHDCERLRDESLQYYLSVFIDEERLIPLKELAKHSSYSQEYLSLRARQGKLDAVKIDNVWYSSKKSLKDYLLEL